MRGGVDDVDNWSIAFTSSMLWANKSLILNAAASCASDGAFIEKLAQISHEHGTEYKPQQQQHLPQYLPRGCSSTVADVDTIVHQIGETNLHLACTAALYDRNNCRESLPDACVYLGGEVPPPVRDLYFSSLRVSSEPGPARSLHLPVLSCKRDRTSLQRWSSCGVRFVQRSLQLGREVLIVCDDGRDRSVGFSILALLLLFPNNYSIIQQPSDTHVQDAQQELSEPQSKPEISKEEPRKVLAALATSAYPAALPTRGILKQVYASARSFEG
jgi:hypothetical protein